MKEKRSCDYCDEDVPIEELRFVPVISWTSGKEEYRSCCKLCYHDYGFEGDCDD